jgi:CubicO group peptidase (beta-lactamase class C family)
MNRRHNPCLILVALLLMTSTLPLTQADETAGRETLTDWKFEDTGAFEDFDDAITELTERWSIPGTQVAVMYGGTLVFYNGYSVDFPATAHNYDLNGSFADSQGGPAIMSTGGTMGATGYSFEPGQGPNLGSAVNSTEYSIELFFSIDETSSFRKLIDFKDQSSDYGLYSQDGFITFFPGFTGPTTVINAGMDHHMVITRDGTSNEFITYVDGMAWISFPDSSNLTTFNGTNNIIHFLQDDIVSMAAEESSGFLDYVRIYDQVLTSQEVTTLFNGYGVSDRESATNVTADSKFRIASLSKAVTSSGILTLIQNGTISLDDKMVDLIPNLLPSTLEGCAYPTHSTSYSIEDITVSHLLNHRAGFDPSSDPTYWHWNTWDNRNDDCLDIDGLNTDYDDGNLAPVSMESILSEWLRRPLDYEPGSDYEYSNIGYQILGQIIEAQSGMGYEAYILENVLTPMGIDSMSIGMTMPDQRAENEVTYYDYENDLSPCHFPSGTDNESGEPIFASAADPDCGGFVIEEKDGGGGWIATAADYARFLAHIDGTLTTTAFNNSYDYFISNPDAPEYSSYYGHGVFVSAANTDIWNHLGAFSGSSTYFKRVMVDNNGTDEPVFVVMFSNTRPTSSLEIEGSSWTSDRTSTISSVIYDVDWANVSLSKPIPPCTPGDTKPADDSCNNCVCTEDENWACTMIYCPDEGEDNETEVEEIPCNPGDTKPAEDGCNTCVCTANEEWACTLMYCPDDINRIPRISLWPGKVNQHNENGTWMTDPDGVSGGHPSSEYPNDYGGREIEYCQKFWPNSTTVQLQNHRETITFYTEGNQVAYNSTKNVYLCQDSEGGIPEFVPVDNPSWNGSDDDDYYDDDYYDDDGYGGGGIPGFGLMAALSMIGLVALKRRRIE